MATLQAATHETPDSTQAGTGAVTGDTNTGHGNTLCTVTIGPEQNSAQSKSCRWFSYSSVPSAKTTLQFNWAISGSLTLTGAAPGTTTATAQFTVEYSTDGGAGWSSALSRSFSLDVSGTTPISDGGSVSLDIAASNPSLVQVRDKVRAQAQSSGDPAVSATSSLTGSVDTLQLAVTEMGATSISMM